MGRLDRWRHEGTEAVSGLWAAVCALAGSPLMWALGLCLIGAVWVEETTRRG